MNIKEVSPTPGEHVDQDQLIADLVQMIDKLYQEEKYFIQRTTFFRDRFKDDTRYIPRRYIHPDDPVLTPQQAEMREKYFFSLDATHNIVSAVAKLKMTVRYLSHAFGKGKIHIPNNPYMKHNIRNSMY